MFTRLPFGLRINTLNTLETNTRKKTIKKETPKNKSAKSRKHKYNMKVKKRKHRKGKKANNKEKQWSCPCALYFLFFGGKRATKNKLKEYKSKKQIETAQ